MLAMVNGYGPMTGADPVENALSLVAFHVVMSIIFLTVGRAARRMAHRRPRAQS